MPPSESTTALRRPVAVLLLLVAAAPSAWTIVRLLRDAGRGLDFTDEGMYLLSADAQSRVSSFHNAYGRYTRVLFLLAGRDVARFRMLGVAVLVVCAAAAGDRIAVAAGHLCRRPVPWTVRGAAAAAVVGGALHYYVLLLITPSYNLMNLAGLLLMVGSLAQLTTIESTRRVDGAWVVLMVLGGAVATMGKISSVLVMLLFVAVVLVAKDTGRSRKELLAWFVAAGVVLVAVHAIFVNPLGVTLRQITRGQTGLVKLDPAYRISEAVRSVFEAIVTITSGSLAAVGAGAVLLVVTTLVVRRDPGSGLSRHVPVLVSVAVLLVAVQLRLLPEWRAPVRPQTAISWVGIAFVLLALCGLPVLVPAVREAGGRARLRLVLVLGLCMLVAAAAYAFGSNNGFLLQISGGTGLLVAVALFLMLLVPDSGGLGLPVLALALVVGASSVTVLSGAEAHPYRQDPLDRQVVAIPIGPDNGIVHVSAQTARFVGDLRTAAEQAGWTEGTPLLDLSAYAASVVYLLQARPPLTIIPSVCCYPGQDALARWSIQQLVRAGGGAAWRNAWVLTLASPKRNGVDLAVLSELGRSLPADYTLVGTFPLPMRGEVLSLWKPRLA